jgi:hypothetical protein
MLLTQEQFIRKYQVRLWFAVSGNGRVIQSAIVNVRSRQDQRRSVKVYMYFDYKLNDYVTEGAL